LKDAGFDLNECLPDIRMGTTPLMDAIARRPANHAVVVALLEAGADANYANFDGASALSSACSFGHKEIARLLIQHGVPTTLEIENWLFDRIADGLEP
jgi:ankyrin repeat protein